MTIKLKEVSVKYTYGGKEQKVLNDINLKLEKGDFITIMGKSGSGKTTLLNCCSFLLNPTSGQIKYNDKIVDFKNKKKLARIRKYDYGLVFQKPNLITALTPLENLIISDNSKDSYKRKKERALDLMTKVGLEDKQNADVKSLSGGEAQKISVIRAIINSPDFILCDEPTGSLDTKSGERILSMLLEYKNKNNCCLIIVTHDDEIGKLGDRIVLIRDGQVYER